MGKLTPIRVFFFWAAGANLVACANATFSFPYFTAHDPFVYAGSSLYYSKQRDICGVCDGDTSSCQGCDKKPNSLSVFDACGDCINPSGSFSNLTCSDCEQNRKSTGRYSELHGGRVLDDCGECRDPTDSSFSHTGAPDYFEGGCIGCDGKPDSANEFDSCGVCSGLGCVSSDPLKYSWCCDCAGLAFGSHIINICCECVNREVYWKALSDGILQGPPENHSFAQDSWARGRARLKEASGLFDSFQRSLVNLTEDGRYMKGQTIYAAYIEAKEYFKEGWEAIKDPRTSDDNSTCYHNVYVAGNVTNPRDTCGICHGDNSSCIGCLTSDMSVDEPIPDGGLFPDDCAVCGGHNLDVDECGICFGDNRTCLGCDGIPNSGTIIDGCAGSSDFRFLSFVGELGEVGSGCSTPAEFQVACKAGEGGCCGCDGVPNSGKTLDGCLACIDQSNPNNTHLINATCNGCDGVAFSGELYDHCCECGGTSSYLDKCYTSVLNDEGSVVPFDPYTMNYSTYYTEEGHRLFDACGECHSLGYNGSTCLGCDGVYGSGLVVDACGICGGDCSTCTADMTGLPYDCELSGYGWTGIDRTCKFSRTMGPRKWLNWTAFPNGTDNRGNKAQTWYDRVNQPGSPAFLNAAKGECHMYLEPPPPPSPRERREWVVKAYGKEEGPFSIDELETGSISVIDATTGGNLSVPLLPTTLIAKISTYTQQQTLHYGYTSQYQSRVQSWKERSGSKLLDSPQQPGVDNIVSVEGSATELSHGGDFMPMGIMPGMEGIVYPYCTGSTWRGKHHRLHGKKLSGSFLGIITSENITDSSGLENFAWNPLDEYIYDVSAGWIDQKCTCAMKWQYGSQPIPPTCPKIWFSWTWNIDKRSSVNHGLHTNFTERYARQERRSWAGGSWRVSGGWWVQDFGGGGSGQYGTLEGSPEPVIYNAYGSPADHGFGATRGPLRLGASGSTTISTFSPFERIDDDMRHISIENEKCFSAARLSRAKRHSAGALWYRERENVSQHWESSFAFFVTEQAKRCTDVYTVSRSFTEAVHTQTGHACSAAGGDGFAFVIRDDTNKSPSSRDVGASGHGLGYQGFHHSLAVEFDTWHNSVCGDPYEQHIALHASGSDPNSAHHDTCLGYTIDIPNFADGKIHHAIVSYSPIVGSDEFIEAIDNGNVKVSTANIARFLDDHTGLLKVYLDSFERPKLTVPISMGSVLGATGHTAWVGFTGSTGESWQAINLLSWNFTSSAGFA